MSVAPRVTVIIPAYNMGEYVGRAIASVLSGTFEDVEVLVVDDGSTDDTAEKVARFVDPDGERYDSRVRYVYQDNQGKPTAVNHGFHVSEGAYIAILDADDKLPRNSLKVRYEEASQSPRADCVIGAFDVIDEAGRTVGRRSAPKTRNRNALRRAYFFSYRTPFHLNSCLLHKDLVKQVGPIDSTLTRCEDIDYALRMLDYATVIRSVDETVYLYRKYRESFRARLRMRWETLKKRQTVLARHAPEPLGPLAALLSVLYDLSKLAYEYALGNYES